MTSRELHVLLAVGQRFWPGAIPLSPERSIVIDGSDASGLPVPGLRQPLFQWQRGQLLDRSPGLLVDGRPATVGMVIPPAAGLRF